MTTTVYLIGAPGVGKSTVMEMLLTGYATGDFHRPEGCGTFGYEVLYDRTPPALDKWVAGVYLGRHRGAFSGTDALSYSALSGAVQWAKAKELPGYVYGEGARLSHPKFLSLLAARGHLILAHLVASDRNLTERRRKRKSDQNEGWMRGAETRARRVAEEMAAAGHEVLRLDADQPAETVARDLLKRISEIG